MPDETANFINELVDTNPDGSVDKVFILDNQIRTIKKALQGSFPNLTSAAINATVVELNKLVGVGTISSIETVGEYEAQQGFKMATLTVGASLAWNLETQQFAKLLTNTSFPAMTLNNPTNQKAGFVYTLIITQAATGGQTLAFGSAYKFPEGVAPVLSIGNDEVDILSFISNGTLMLGGAQFDFK